MIIDFFETQREIDERGCNLIQHLFEVLSENIVVNGKRTQLSDNFLWLDETAIRELQLEER